MRLSLFAIALLLASACSNEPKGTPDGTIKAYYRAANSKDFAAMSRMLAPESAKRLGSNAAGYLSNSFSGWEDFDISIDDVRINTDEKTGTVRFSCTGKVIGRDMKLHPASCNDLYSVVKQADDLWYLILPETQKIRPM